MELLPNNTYRMLLFISKEQKEESAIAEKFGDTASYRLNELLECGYVRYSRNSGKLIITDSGKSYLEDHTHFVKAEINSALKTGIIYPVIVAFLTSVITNVVISALTP